MKSEKEILWDLRRAIAKDAQEVNPDSPEMVYDPIELEKLLKLKENEAGELITKKAEVMQELGELKRLWERYYELLIFLEGNLVILGSCPDITPEDGIYFFESYATHREKNRIARRCIHQISFMKSAVKNRIREKDQEDFLSEF